MTTTANELTYRVALHSRPNLGEPFSGVLEVTVAPGASPADIAAAARREAFKQDDQRIGLIVTGIELVGEREQAW